MTNDSHAGGLVLEFSHAGGMCSYRANGGLLILPGVGAEGEQGEATGTDDVAFGPVFETVAHRFDVGDFRR